jgi:hypothetical protein
MANKCALRRHPPRNIAAIHAVRLTLDPGAQAKDSAWLAVAQGIPLAARGGQTGRRAQALRRTQRRHPHWQSEGRRSARPSVTDPRPHAALAPHSMV